MPSKKDDAFVAGGILAVLGLYLIGFVHDLQGGFVLLGIGVVIMASTSEKFREALYEFFLSIFKGIWKLVTSLKSE